MGRMKMNREQRIDDGDDGDGVGRQDGKKMKREQMMKID